MIITFILFECFLYFGFLLWYHMLSQASGIIFFLLYNEFKSYTLKME